MARRHACAAKGQRAVGRLPFGRRRLTVLGALGLEGVVASMSAAAATSTVVPLAFVEQALLSALRGRPDAIVVTGNLGVHKAPAVRRALDAAGAATATCRPTRPT